MDPFTGELAPPANVHAMPGGERQWREWQAELERVIPRSTKVSWLYLRYQGAEAWDTANCDGVRGVHRLMLWQVEPFVDGDWVSEAKRDALKGGNPRATGHACFGKGFCPTDPDGTVLCSKVRNRWVQDGDQHKGAAWQVSKEQWEIYREIGQYATPWWVIQGSSGGHRRMLEAWEQQMLWHASDGRVESVPRPGDLPYAPFDARVLQWVKEYDLMTKWKDEYQTDFTKRSWEDLERTEQEGRKKIGELWGKWLLAQVDEMFDAGRSAWRELASEHHVGGQTYLRDQRKVEHRTWEAKWEALVSGQN